MPSHTRNTGMQSLSELFAMKKNISFQAHFDYTLASMTKDYIHRRENFKQEMKKVYSDMRNIRISTGYSLDQVRSANATGPFRNPNPPTVYFPPIGVRLVQKYVGVDVKTGATEHTGKSIPKPDRGTTVERPSPLSKSLETVKAPDAVRTAIRKMSMINANDVALSRKLKPNHVTSNARHVTFREKERLVREKSVDIVITPVPDNEDLSEECDNDKMRPGLRIHETDEIAKLRNAQNRQVTLLPPINQRYPSTLSTLSKEVDIDAEESSVSQTSDDNVNDVNPGATDADDVDRVFIETSYNLTERRSSRSTFRTRSSVRLVSQSNLSEHNLEVINKSTSERKRRSRGSSRNSKVKPEVPQFYLDYGDGKLHDNMKIPKIQDCARTWCNPHCHTCLRRANRGPCFILVPKTENDRKRQVPKDARRLSMFPIYRGSSDLSQSSSTDSEVEPVPETNTNQKTNKMDDEDKNEEAHSRDDNGAETAFNKDLDALLKERIQKRKKGFSKKRIDELALPRGVPPAEVRFSKTSLRRKQEQLKEGERHRLMTLEERNQTIIQGKISMFLALLNEQENVVKPTKMVDIPIREDVTGVRRKSGRRKHSRRVRLNVNMDPRRFRAFQIKTTSKK